MEFLSEKDFLELSNPGVTSLQLVSPHNSASDRVTVTKVTVAPGAKQPPHSHEASEQIWIALAGEGCLLLEQGKTRRFRAGQVVRFESGDIHGVQVCGPEAFVYLAITSPPLDFAGLYGG